MNGLTSLIFSQATPPTTPNSGVQMRCELYNGFKPTVDNIAGNILGLVSFAGVLVVALAAILIFAAPTKHRGTVMRSIGVILAAVVGVALLPSVVNAVSGAHC